MYVDIGSVISIYPAVQFGKLHHRTLEKENILLLKKSVGTFEAKNTKRVIEELYWRLETILCSICTINKP